MCQLNNLSWMEGGTNKPDGCGIGILMQKKLEALALTCRIPARSIGTRKAEAH